MAVIVEPDGVGTADAGPGLLAAARKYPVFLILGAVIGAALAGIITTLLPVNYTAHAQLLLGDDSDVTIYHTTQPTNAVARAQAAATAMRSDEVFQAASKRLHDRVSATSISKTITVAPSDTAALVTISATRTSGQLAADVANAVATAYIGKTNRDSAIQSQHALSTIKSQQDDVLARLNTTQRQQTARADTLGAQYAGVTDLTDRARLVQGALNSDTRYQALTRQADRLSDTLSDLKLTETQTRVDAQLIAEGVDTLYPATTPANSSNSTLRRNVLVGAVLGLLVGLIIAWRRLDRRRGQSSDAVAAALGAPLLGRVPSTREMRVPTAVVNLAVGRELADHLRVLATSVVIDARRRGLSGVLITSAEPREGRTVLTANLAAAAAGVGHDVVLVDGDTRHPDLTAAAGAGGASGLGESLTSKSPTSLLAFEASPDLDLPFLPVGSPTAESASGRLDLRRSDGDGPLAIIDTAAIGENAFTLAMAAQSWAGLVIVVSDVATIDQLAAIRSQADRTGSPVLGFVLNEHRASRRRPRRAPQATQQATYRGRRRDDSPTVARDEHAAGPSASPKLT